MDVQTSGGSVENARRMHAHPHAISYAATYSAPACELGPVLALDYYAITARPPGCNCIEPVVLFIAAVVPLSYRDRPFNRFITVARRRLYYFFDNSLADFSTPALKRSLITIMTTHRSKHRDNRDTVIV